MIENIFVNLNAGAIGSSRVNSVSDPTSKSFQTFVGDDSRTFNIYLVDGQGNYIAPTLVKELKVALGDAGSTPYAETSVFTPISNGFQVILPLNSSDLATALNGGAITTLFEIETCDFSNYSRTILQTQVDVTGQVIDSDSYNNPIFQESFIVGLSNETSDLEAGSEKISFRVPFNFLLQEIRGSLNVASTGSSVIVDLNVDGNSILSTPLSIDAGELTSTTASVLPVFSSSLIPDDSRVSLDIDQIGSTTAGAGLKITLSGRRG